MASGRHASQEVGVEGPPWDCIGFERCVAGKRFNTKTQTGKPTVNLGFSMVPQNACRPIYETIPSKRAVVHCLVLGAIGGRNRLSVTRLGLLQASYDCCQVAVDGVFSA